MTESRRCKRVAQDGTATLDSAKGNNSGGSKIYEEGDGAAEDNVSAPSSFIENARHELYLFYAGKGGLLKMLRPIAGEGTPPSPV